MNEIIPKTIHYCWFGKKPLPLLAKKCIRSWEKYCPEYRIMKWSEENFRIYEAPVYVQEAYEAGKWAFVADYVRFYALVKYGGIYLDTDMELLKSLNSFLKNEAFTSTEDDVFISAGAMGCIANHPLFCEFKDYYQNRSFIKDDGSMDMTTVVAMMTEKCEKRGYENSNGYRKVAGMVIYPSDYFYPFSNLDNVMRKTDHTVAIHWFAGSWVPKDEKKRMKEYRRKKKARKFLKLLFGQQRIDQVKKLLGYK